LQKVKELPKHAILARHIELLSKQNKSKSSKIHFCFFSVATCIFFSRATFSMYLLVIQKKFLVIQICAQMPS